MIFATQLLSVSNLGARVVQKQQHFMEKKVFAFSEFLRDSSFFLSRMLDILQILTAGSFWSDGLKYPA